MSVVEKDEIVTGLLIGTADTPERAASVAGFFNKCPYCAHASHTGNIVIAALSFPPNHKWWFESMADDPAGTIGLQAAEAIYLERINAQSPWSSGRIGQQMAQPPCGAECSTCRMYQHNCPGCPASRSFID
ncbi:MAG: hypothetical protein PVI51_01350 [candidate division WOR-3 bacterium]|jgi:hypothetical protein